MTVTVLSFAPMVLSVGFIGWIACLKPKPATRKVRVCETVDQYGEQR